MKNPLAGICRSFRRKKGLSYLVLAVFALLWALPVLWMALAALDGNANIFMKAPDRVTLDNFRSVVSSKSNQQAMLNSLLLSLGVAICVVTASTLAGYVLSRYQSKLSKSYMLTILFMTTLPGTVLIVPVYKMFVLLKLYDSLLGIVLFLTATTLPYSIWMMKNFMDSIPIELEEAAAVDGAGHWARLYHVVAPLVLPGICCVGIRAFAAAWGDFMTPYILLSSSGKYTASITMYKYIDAFSVSYGNLAAFSILYSFPSIFLYILAQRFMSKGFSLSGANKG